MLIPHPRRPHRLTALAVLAAAAALCVPAAAPGASTPDATAPDAVAPDAVAPDAFAPDALAPDALAPGTADAVAGPECGERDVTQPFQPWQDEGLYFLAPNGGFEDRFAGWRFSAGAKVGSGNERLGLIEPGAKMLRLGGSGVAASEPFCVTEVEESFRFAVRNAGDPTSTLAVWADVTVAEDTGPRSLSVLLGTMRMSGTAWQPSPIFAYGRFPTHDAQLSIRFEASSPEAPGDWRVDAVLVDPYRCC